MRRKWKNESTQERRMTKSAIYDAERHDLLFNVDGYCYTNAPPTVLMPRGCRSLRSHRTQMLQAAPFATLAILCPMCQSVAHGAKDGKTQSNRTGGIPRGRRSSQIVDCKCRPRYVSCLETVIVSGTAKGIVSRHLQ
eukprot:6199753-Pleurochrysis_carterae.AAC.2